MSEFNLASGASVVPHEPTPLPSTDLHHAVGIIEEMGPISKSETRSTGVYHQMVPANPLGDFLCRYAKIKTATITNTNTVGQTVISFDPWVEFLANPAVADKIKNFSLVRGTIEVVAMMAIPGNCYGTYVLSTAANGGVTTVDAAVNSFEVGAVQPWETCMQVDHYARVNCSDSENLVLQLPFLWPYDFANLPAGPAGSWIVNLFCLSPLRTAIPGGVSTGNISFYARIMEDVQMSVPKLQGHERKGAINMHPALKKIAPKLAEKIPPGSISSTMSSISHVADAVSGVPVIGAYAAAASKVASTIGDVASWFGFTKEASPTVPISVAQRSFSSVANIDGSDNGDISALSVANAISIDPSIGGGVVGNADCLATADLFARWTHVNSFTWQSTDAAGTTLASIPVTPAYVESALSSCPIVAGWFGFPFAYWRGDMEYLVILPVSKLHRGTVQAFWVPFGTTSIAADITNVAINEIQGLGSDDETVYKIGFARDKPFLLNEKIGPDGIINTSWTNGTFLLRVVNPLVSQNGTAVVTGHVFARGGSNMQFGFPRSTAWDYDAVNAGYRILDNWTYQGKESVTQEVRSLELVKSSGDYPVDEILFGEKIESVRAMLQKPCRFFNNNTVNSTPGQNKNMYIPQLGPLPKIFAAPANSLPLSNNFSYQGWYRAAFTGIATSERVKYTSSVAGQTCRIGPYRIDSTFGYENYPNLGPVDNVSCIGSTQGYEGIVPFYLPRKFALGRQNFGCTPGTTAEFENRGIKVFATVGTATETGNAALFHSYGPDIRVTNFRFIPRVSTYGFDKTRPSAPLFPGVYPF